jgi:hypothetical protein
MAHDGALAVHARLASVRLLRLLYQGIHLEWSVVRGDARSGKPMTLMTQRAQESRHRQGTNAGDGQKSANGCSPLEHTSWCFFGTKPKRCGSHTIYRPRRIFRTVIGAENRANEPTCQNGRWVNRQLIENSSVTSWGRDWAVTSRALLIRVPAICGALTMLREEVSREIEKERMFDGRSASITPNCP